MDYLECKAVVTALEIQREMNKYDRDIAFLKFSTVALERKRLKLKKQLQTLKDNYRECEL